MSRWDRRRRGCASVSRILRATSHFVGWYSSAIWLGWARIFSWSRLKIIEIIEIMYQPTNQLSFYIYLCKVPRVQNYLACFAFLLKRLAISVSSSVTGAVLSILHRDMPLRRSLT
jgi:hypothetical protein